MRIIKSKGADTFKVIAGEMYNIESSMLKYIDGEPVQNPIKGYPRVQHGNIVDIIKSECGYIFVPAETNLIEFENGLVDAITLLTTIDKPPLDSYHSAEIGYCTNIKVKSSLVRARKTTDRESTNTCRKFGLTAGKYTSARFTWYIVPINKFVFEIESDSMSDAIARYVCSVFVDLDDICKLGHNETTFEFSRDLLRGADNIIPHKVKLFTNGPPLLVELSTHWREMPEIKSRNINNSNLFIGKYNDFTIHDVLINDKTFERSNEICAGCQSPLWGDNYILTKGDVLEGTAMCPLCLHNADDEARLDKKNVLYRVAFPRTAETMIDMITGDETLRDIYLELNRQNIYVSMNVGERNVKYTLVGKKYAAFEHLDDYLFTHLMFTPDLKSRKVFTLAVDSAI